MKSWRCTNLLIALACAPALLAADWLPLQTGNQWIYRGSGTHAQAPLVLLVGEAREFAGHTYYQLEGLPEGTYWLRNDGDRVVQWKEDTSQDALRYDFSRGVGEAYATNLRGLAAIATVSKAQSSLSTPAGSFSDVVSLTYTYAPVREGDFTTRNVTGEAFASGVGVLLQEFSDRNGVSAKYELVYARLGSSTVLKGPENGIQLSLNEDKTWARLQVDAQPSSIKILRLYDETGSEVWSWTSAQKWFNVTGDPNVELPAMKPGQYVLTAEAGDARISLPFTVQ
ncbi:hypothetical protein [Paludibaculum fermentans]|uniref:FlgD Ig-like domain-containing protein n=1 Tax=Paludibaculum fermentans TaxID=1473598 RepID=A0A7S7NU20_PALFE|nr:hypothetical protein [Paludibaculum fermentans]QOY89711.1 hypothetical protein IRI77_07095 [Paludibaculum fermentans]